MIFGADEIKEELPGRQLLAALREPLVDEDDRIRRMQQWLVETGRLAEPDPGQLDRAHRLHALDRVLEHAIQRGPNTTVKELTQVARDAWFVALRGQVDASGDQRDEPSGVAPPDQAGSP
jgi:hypothetical protein